MTRFISIIFCLALFGCDGKLSLTDDGAAFGGPNSGENENNTSENNSENNALPELELPEDCVTAAGYFEREVWPKVGDATCVSCHTESGSASNSTFRVLPTEAPDHLTQNFIAFSRQAELTQPDFQGRSLLELKAINVIAHEGGTAIEPGGSANEILSSFAARINGTHQCDPSTLPPLDIPFYEGVTFSEDVEILRRVSLALAGRLPTNQEIELVAANGLDGLDLVMDSLMTEPAFDARIKESFHDVFLTAGFDDVPESVFGYTHFFPFESWLDAFGEPEIYDVLEDLRAAVKDEPMELIAHIVREDRPFTHILTADYMVMSPYTARSWGVFDDISGQFQNQNDPLEFIETRLPALRYWEGSTAQVWPENDTGFYAHAGIQTTFNYLLRHRSTDTNRNRLRARQFFEIFLGVDVLELGPAVVDSAAIQNQFAVPTMEAPDCVVCHRILDPVAGLFRDYSNIGEMTPRDWYDDMFAPGYDVDSPLPESQRYRSLQWLGERAAQDERFAPAMVGHAYYVLTQDKVLKPPTDTEDPLFDSKRNGYLAQREMIVAASQEFVSDNHNFKTAIKEIAKSPFYRANGAVDQVEDLRRETELTVLGLGELLTPEQLERKLTAIFDTNWDRMAVDQLYQRGEFYMLYGGLDYYAIFERVTQPNGVMGAIMRLMSNQISCEFAQRDLSTGTGLISIQPGEVNEAAVRDAMVSLHWEILGDRTDPDSPAIDRAYALFSDLVTEGQSRLADGSEPQALPNGCNAYFDTDPDYTIRAWQGIYTYLLRHPQFLIQ